MRHVDLWNGSLMVSRHEGSHTSFTSSVFETLSFSEAKGVTDFTNATIYTTLEPCHRGPGKSRAWDVGRGRRHRSCRSRALRRTPPCDELVVAKKVKRCVGQPDCHRA